MSRDELHDAMREDGWGIMPTRATKRRKGVIRTWVSKALHGMIFEKASGDCEWTVATDSGELVSGTSSSLCDATFDIWGPLYDESEPVFVS